MFVCLFAPAWPDGDPIVDLLTVVPRITIAADVVWADAHGLSARQISLELIARATALGVAGVRAGVARVPVVAELAARTAQPHTAVVVADEERAFLTPLPLAVFAGHDRLLALLDGVGVRTCGQLAELDREAVEVRFGGEALELWQWSRAQDTRRIFTRTAPEHLHAATDFVDYVVTDPERLIFVANALFGTVCDQLRGRGEHARRVLLTLSLGNRTTWQRTIRPARPTASRAVWLRLARALLERLTVPDAVTGIMIEVSATEPAAAVQGDLFDAGFATAAAVDGALARLVELHGDIVVQPETTKHQLIERRAHWRPAEWTHPPLDTLADSRQPEFQLRPLTQPREILVEAVQRRDHLLPVRYRDGQWREIVTAAGPDRISGGRWEEAYAREYFRVVTVAGELVWIYRDAREDRWYLHGYWD